MNRRTMGELGALKRVYCFWFRRGLVIQDFVIKYRHCWRYELIEEFPSGSFCDRFITIGISAPYKIHFVSYNDTAIVFHVFFR